MPPNWDDAADIVVIGSGATGLPAAIVAREAGASVILVEAQSHIGGHAIVSGGNLPLGGGNSFQKNYGIEDSPDLLFRDLTDWTVVEPNGAPPYRYNDREIVRAFADNSVATFDFLLTHGVKIVDRAPDNLSGHEVGISVPRTLHCAALDLPLVQTGIPVDPSVQATTSSGSGLMQPLYVAACNAGVRILLQHRMTAVHREASPSGRVTGIAADHNGTDRNIRAQKAVVIATGGWRVPMPPQTLAGAVSRYNGFVESGADLDFEKPRPLYKIAKPPFYAAWATPVIHDTRAGLRINARCQVLSLDGAVIPSLYCGGESAGGFSMHGLPRALCQGFIAGRNTAAEVSHG